MLGQMQNWPLLVSKLLESGEVNHPNREVFSMLPEGGEFRYTFKDLALRARKCAQAMERLGIEKGDRVATLAWNTHRHVELWFAGSGMGGVTHTVNPRLFPEQLIYIMNHAEDKILFLDVTFVPLIEKLAPMLETIEHYVIMVGREHMPETSLPNVICYEEFVEAEDGSYEWPQLDENTACGLCYTSGTTGNPKGVLYSHRSNFLHTLTVLQKDVLSIGAHTVILPVVPMFHANAWGIPYAALAAGSKLVLNGPHHDPETLHMLLIREKVTMTAAVPTVWMQMLRYLKENDLNCGELKDVTIGGSAVPRSMIQTFQDDYGVRVNHAWGMTECSPLGSLGSENSAVAELSNEEKLDVQCKQGRPVLGVEMAIKDDDGNHLPWDGKSSGRLMVRGPWIVESYYRSGETALDDEGWFDTGDVSLMDEYGFMQITDRAKDVIKSGGEWISSIDLENEAVGHPGVAEAGVIGVYHPKWDERPLLCIVEEDGQTVTKEEMLAYLDGKIAKWWMPDDVVTVEELPHTATGKISKKDLRDQFKDYKLPGT
ncbi:long-chain-fatty-acid--CoA ligase [Kordiimonas sp. SCSIO 12603]|uniref:long-chain-fatty-acid--CoA ligase n=1 Tax=Kordiimonas sp. SCSIO 12603 TaxID=2829596 RepID=UPI0021026DF6|nr:long-chain-fatty-acid--CoA ligase [Kordiimonas sp. SCSIO 12603]